jgi:peptidylprolyl isomerase
MAQAKVGDIVKVFYIGRFEDGTIVDHSPGSEPFQFKIGDGAMIQGFEEALVGMGPGEMKTIDIPAAKAYGEWMDGMTLEFSRSRVKSLESELGDILEITLPSGRKANMVVVEVTKSKVVLDANHPLAGRNILFDIEMVAIVSGSR